MTLWSRVACAASCSLALGGCIFPTYESRFGMRVAFDVDGRTVERSGHYSVKWTDETQSPALGWVTKVCGSSPVFDLGDGILTFPLSGNALKYGAKSKFIPYFPLKFLAQRDSVPSDEAGYQQFRNMSGARGRWMLQGDDLPPMVWIPRDYQHRAAILIDATRLNRIQGHTVKFKSAHIEAPPPAGANGAAMPGWVHEALSEPPAGGTGASPHRPASEIAMYELVGCQ